MQAAAIAEGAITQGQTGAHRPQIVEQMDTLPIDESEEELEESEEESEPSK